MFNNGFMFISTFSVFLIVKNTNGAFDQMEEMQSLTAKCQDVDVQEVPIFRRKRWVGCIILVLAGHLGEENSTVCTR